MVALAEGRRVADEEFFWNGMFLDVYSRGFGDAEVTLGDRGA